MERSASIFAGKRPMLVSRVATMFKRVRCIVTFFRLWTHEERHRKTRVEIEICRATDLAPPQPQNVIQANKKQIIISQRWRGDARLRVLLDPQLHHGSATAAL